MDGAFKKTVLERRKKQTEIVTSINKKKISSEKNIVSRHVISGFSPCIAGGHEIQHPQLTLPTHNCNWPLEGELASEENRGAATTATKSKGAIRDIA